MDDMCQIVDQEYPKEVTLTQAMTSPCFSFAFVMRKTNRVSRVHKMTEKLIAVQLLPKPKFTHTKESLAIESIGSFA